MISAVHPEAAIAAEVGERAVTVAQVDAREAALRAGPLAARLPHPHSAEGRNLRRWLVQVLVTEALIEQEAAARGLAAPDDGDAPTSLTLTAALRTGGVVAAVTASMPLARVLRRAVTAGVGVGEREVRAYYDRNLDRYTRPESRHVSRVEGASLGRVRRGELPGPLEAAVFAAGEGEVAGPVDGPGGPWTVRVEGVDPGGRVPFETVREEIAAELTALAVERAFARWLERRAAERVRLRHGFEHPADPQHSDATHRH
ncbi:peptidylprolyl isomerase [Sphaerisporangium sp. TRM90804]|uniref:peptidylprolyl isomerase n=1 Tax=Sphaerisporangium sp. TRM90804 TaxID=3031113 RepID=UPI00244CCC1D|nr:peptidylprolyl isomerase [Sphaerisporangium sp. TRM90804]MDH2424431.1 peptidylprolyl isomerase [Sphaerisporangium sp. TRM90804]